MNAMDRKAFYKLSSGVYIISSDDGENRVGCVVNTVLQATSSPARLSVAVNKENFTCGVIGRSGLFGAMALAQDADMSVIQQFGFKTSADTDKFAGLEYKLDENGVAYLVNSIAARYSCKVTDSMDAGTHIIFLGEVTEAEVLSASEPLTYAYYQSVKKGVTPPKAPSYSEPEAAKGWRCTVCGYIHESDTLPDDFICPVCGQPRAVFEKI